MGKKNNKNKKQKKIIKHDGLPFVSVCTPTFNRRPFIQMMIHCFDSQTYPKDKMEWIIVDDGDDKIEDLVKDHPQVKYFKYDEKMKLGKKRNVMHEKSCGEIIVYMDDDDYYPPCRVSHSVEKLLSDSNALCAGSSEIFVYFNHIEQMYKFGPYNSNHATAGTFAFKRKLLETSTYDNDACLAEEKKFLKNYTVPFIQLDSLKTILVFSHIHNTFDKKTIIPEVDNKVANKSSITIDTFIKDKEIIHFFKTIDSLLEYYPIGGPECKPDVSAQYNQIMKERKLNDKSLIMNQNGKERVLTNQEILKIINDYKDKVKKYEEEIKKLKENSPKFIMNQNGNKVVLSNQDILNIISQYKNKTQELENENIMLRNKILLFEENNISNNSSSL